MKSIVRIEKRINPYVQIDHTCLDDKRLSFKAKGILAYLLSKPSTWKVRIADLVNHSPADGEESIRNGLKELEKFGYARLERGGAGYGSCWIVFEIPQTDMAVTATSEPPADMAETPTSRFPDIGETATLSNKELISNNKGGKSNNRVKGTPTFQKPSREEYLSYAGEINLSTDQADSFYDYFEANGWRVGGKSPMRDWKAAMRNWKRNDDRFHASRGTTPVKAKNVPCAANDWNCR